MQASNLKASLITACCFVIALCSEIKSMDNASDFQETKSYKAKNINSKNCLGSLKAEVSGNSSSALLLLKQDENKAPETSWTSYIASPVKAVIQGTYNIVDFTVKHPSRTLITSLLIAAQFTAIAADCNCILQVYGITSSNGYSPQSLGMFPNETECEAMVKACSTTYPCRYYGCF